MRCVALALLTLLSSGCASLRSTPAVDPTDAALASAAWTLAREKELLFDNSARPAVAPNFDRKLSVEWVGDAVALASKLSRISGVSFSVQGQQRPINVVVRARGLTVVEVYRQLGMQLGKNVVLTLNLESAVSTLHFKQWDNTHTNDVAQTGAP